MQLIINTTPTQDAALADINAQNYPPNPILSNFATMVILGKLDDLVASNQASKLDASIQSLRQTVNQLTAQDFATISGVTSKYISKQVVSVGP